MPAEYAGRDMETKQEIDPGRVTKTSYLWTKPKTRHAVLKKCWHPGPGSVFHSVRLARRSDETLFWSPESEQMVLVRSP